MSYLIYSNRNLFVHSLALRAHETRWPKQLRRVWFLSRENSTLENKSKLRSLHFLVDERVSKLFFCADCFAPKRDFGNYEDLEQELCLIYESIFVLFHEQIKGRDLVLATKVVIVSYLCL